MKHFETMIARYNSTLPTISSDNGQELQLTSRGILYVTMADLNGVPAVVKDGDNVGAGADRGFIAYGVNASDITHPLLLDANGYLMVNIAAGSISVDFTPGTDYDEGCDEAGVNTEPGVVGGITGAYTIITSVSIPNGGTLALEAFDFTADSEAQFQLVKTSSGPIQYIRTVLLPENQGTNQIVFPRPKEILATDAYTAIELRAKNLRGRTMSAAGGINAYLKPE